MQAVVFTTDDQGRLNVALSTVGSSKHLAAINSEAGAECRIVGVYRGGEDDLQTFRHRLKEQYIVGNWFHLDSDAKAVVRAIRSLTNVNAAEKKIRGQLHGRQPARAMERASSELCHAASELVGSTAYGV